MAKRLIIFILISFLGLSAKSQYDTVINTVGKKAAFWKSEEGKNSEAGPTYKSNHLFYKKIVFRDTLSTFHGLISNDTIESKSLDNFKYKNEKSFYIVGSVIENTLIERQDWTPFFEKNTYTVTDILFRETAFLGKASFNGIKAGSISFRDGNKIPYISFYNDTADIQFTGNDISEGISLTKCSSLLSLNYNKCDTFNMYIDSSKIKGVHGGPNNFTRSQYLFIADSLVGDIGISMNPDTSQTEKYSTVIFTNCYIDANIILSLADSSYIAFNNCRFGPSATYLNLYAQQIHFTDCREFAKPASLSMRSDAKIYFSNTLLQNLDFSYTPNNRLVHNPDNKDQTVSIYETLLGKFKTEGKTESYKNLDIEYSQYKYSLTTFGWLISFLDRIWWYYGYRTYYIVYWTIAFIIFFFLINTSNWTHVSNTYNIVPEGQATWYDQTNSSKYEYKRLFRVFIFTVFIFFSLNINFDKLSFNKTRWLMWFFVQYIVGLFCLLFIANAIIKF